MRTATRRRGTPRPAPCSPVPRPRPSRFGLGPPIRVTPEPRRALRPVRGGPTWRRAESAPGHQMTQRVAGLPTTPRRCPPPRGTTRPDPPRWQRSRRTTGAARPGAAVTAVGLASRCSWKRRLQVVPGRFRSCSRSPPATSRRPRREVPVSIGRPAPLDPAKRRYGSNPSPRVSYRNTGSDNPLIHPAKSDETVLHHNDSYVRVVTWKWEPTPDGYCRGHDPRSGVL